MLPGLLANMDWPDYAVYMLFTPGSGCHGAVYRGELGEYVVVSSSHIVLTEFKAYTLFTPIQGFVFWEGFRTGVCRLGICQLLVRLGRGYLFTPL